MLKRIASLASLARNDGVHIAKSPFGGGRGMLRKIASLASLDRNDGERRKVPL